MEENLKTIGENEYWDNGYYTFKDAYAYFKEETKYKNLSVFLFSFAGLALAGILLFFLLGNNPYFLLLCAPYTIFLLVIAFIQVPAIGSLLGTAFLGTLSCSFFMIVILSFIFGIEIDKLQPYIYGALPAFIVVATLLWGYRRCFSVLYDRSNYKAWLTFFDQLRAKKGNLTEEEYDRQIRAKVEEHNNTVILEQRYQDALWLDSTDEKLEEMKALANLGYEKAKTFLKPYLELSIQEGIIYGMNAYQAITSSSDPDQNDEEEDDKEDEKDKVLNSIIDLFKRGLNCHNEVYRICATIMALQIKYDLELYSEDDYAELKADQQTAVELQKRKEVASIFELCGLDMDRICSRLIGTCSELIYNYNSSSYTSDLDPYFYTHPDLLAKKLAGTLSFGGYGSAKEYNERVNCNMWGYSLEDSDPTLTPEERAEIKRTKPFSGY